MQKPLLAAPLLAAFALLGSAVAHAEVIVAEPWVRATVPAQKATGAFMQIRNTSDAERKLVKAESPVAKTVELHNHVNENGVMKMRPVTHIVVPAHGKAELKPGSYHVMLIDLKAPLKEGEAVPLTLSFDDGSTQRVDAPVRKPHDGAPTGHGHGKSH